MKLIELEKECDFPEFVTKLIILKVITSTIDKKLRNKLLYDKNKMTTESDK